MVVPGPDGHLGVPFRRHDRILIAVDRCAKRKWLAAWYGIRSDVDAASTQSLSMPSVPRAAALTICVSGNVVGHI